MEIPVRNKIVESVEQETMKKGEKIPQFHVGDTVDVSVLIREGEKERVQVFSGTVIQRKGTGINQTFTVRRIVNNEGVERIFPVHSPFVQEVKVKRNAEVRRAKLFFLRERVGKATRLVEKAKRKTKDGAEGKAELAGSAT